MINVSAYPQCARILHFQKVNLTEPGFNKYWAAVNVASALPDSQLTDFGGFNFRDRSDKNGGKLLSRLEKFMTQRGQRYVKNAVLADQSLVAVLGANGVKTTMLKTEDDFWTAAETLFPGLIDRNGGKTSLYVQIHGIDKKKRKALVSENLRRLPREWVSAAPSHQAKLGGVK